MISRDALTICAGCGRTGLIFCRLTLKDERTLYFSSLTCKLLWLDRFSDQINIRRVLNYG